MSRYTEYTRLTGDEEEITQMEQALAASLGLTVAQYKKQQERERLEATTVATMKPVDSGYDDEFATAIALSLQEVDADFLLAEARSLKPAHLKVPTTVVLADYVDNDSELAQALERSRLAEEAVNQELQEAEAQIIAASLNLAEVEAEERRAQERALLERAMIESWESFLIWEAEVGANVAANVALDAAMSVQETQNPQLFDEILLPYLKNIVNLTAMLEHFKKFDSKKYSLHNYAITEFGLFEVVFESTPNNFKKIVEELQKLFDQATIPDDAVSLRIRRGCLIFTFLDKASQEQFFTYIIADVKKQKEAFAQSSDEIEPFLEEVKPRIQLAKLAIAAAQAEPRNDILFEQAQNAIRVINYKTVGEFVRSHSSDNAKFTTLKAELKTIMAQYGELEAYRSQPEIAAVAEITGTAVDSYVPEAELSDDDVVKRFEFEVDDSTEQTNSRAKKSVFGILSAALLKTPKTPVISRREKVDGDIRNPALGLGDDTL